MGKTSSETNSLPGHQKEQIHLIKSRNYKVPKSQRPRLEHPHEHNILVLICVSPHLSYHLCYPRSSAPRSQLLVPNQPYEKCLLETTGESRGRLLKSQCPEAVSGNQYPVLLVALGTHSLLSQKAVSPRNNIGGAVGVRQS